MKKGGPQAAAAMKKAGPWGRGCNEKGRPMGPANLVLTLILAR